MITAISAALEAFYLEHRYCRELERRRGWPRLDDVHVRRRAGARRGVRPRWLSLPSALRRLPQTSRGECARPIWQNNIATNWPQHVKMTTTPARRAPAVSRRILASRVPWRNGARPAAPPDRLVPPPLGLDPGAPRACAAWYLFDLAGPVV